LREKRKTGHRVSFVERRWSCPTERNDETRNLCLIALAHLLMQYGKNATLIIMIMMIIIIMLSKAKETE
jgi:hypothetical protein